MGCPRAGAGIEGNCPFKGVSGRGRLVAGGSEREAPGVLRGNLCFLKSVCPPGRGRGDVMGLRPLRSPLPTPRSTPLGIVHSSHPIPFGFQGKPPLWVPGSESRPSAHAPCWADHTRLAGRNESGRSASRARSVEQMWTPQRAGQYHGRSPAGQKEVCPLAAVRVARKGERKTEVQSAPTRQAVWVSKLQRCYEPRGSTCRRCYEPRGSTFDTRHLARTRVIL